MAAIWLNSMVVCVCGNTNSMCSFLCLNSFLLHLNMNAMCSFVRSCQSACSVWKKSMYELIISIKRCPCMGNLINVNIYCDIESMNLSIMTQSFQNALKRFDAFFVESLIHSLLRMWLERSVAPSDWGWICGEHTLQDTLLNFQFSFICVVYRHCVQIFNSVRKVFGLAFWKFSMYVVEVNNDNGLEE